MKEKGRGKNDKIPTGLGLARCLCRQKKFIQIFRGRFFSRLDKFKKKYISIDFGQGKIFASSPFVGNAGGFFIPNIFSSIIPPGFVQYAGKRVLSNNISQLHPLRIMLRKGVISFVAQSQVFSGNQFFTAEKYFFRGTKSWEIILSIDIKKIATFLAQMQPREIVVM